MSERERGGGSRERGGRTREEKELRSLQDPSPLPTAAMTRHPVYDICLLQLCVNVYMEWLSGQGTIIRLIQNTNANMRTTSTHY